ncbi:MAG: hypothetical protein NT169_14400 [Chloroflexi bacterium]|nr:hypothetical protein [Chloroflexota bacterium]
MPKEKDSLQGISKSVEKAPTFYSKRCPHCGSTEFEWVVREGRRVEVCEKCGHAIETEKR